MSWKELIEKRNCKAVHAHSSAQGLHDTDILGVLPSSVSLAEAR